MVTLPLKVVGPVHAVTFELEFIVKSEMTEDVCLNSKLLKASIVIIFSVVPSSEI